MSLVLDPILTPVDPLPSPSPAAEAQAVQEFAKTLIEEELANGSKINAIKILKTYLEEAEELPTHHSLRGCKDAIDLSLIHI